VALSVTKALNPEQKRAFRVPDGPDPNESLRVQGRRIALAHETAWKSARDSRTIDAAVEFRCMAWVEKGAFLCAASNVFWHYLAREYDLNQFAWREVVDRFEDGFERPAQPRTSQPSGTSG